MSTNRISANRMTDLVERRAIRMVGTRPRHFWIGSLGWVLFFVYPLLPGWILKSIFDEVRSEVFRGRLVWLLGAFLLVSIAMAVIIRLAHRTYNQGFSAAQSMTRLNVMHAQLVSGGSDRGPRTVSAGDAVVRLRDDPNDLVMLVDNWLDVVGSIGYAVVALVVLASIDSLAALAILVPLTLVGLLNRVAGNHLRKLRSASRAATSKSTEFLAAAFGAASTIKVSGAQPGVIRRIDQLNHTRAAAMVKDQVWSDSLWNANSAATDISVGVALLVASRRNLTASEVTLFTSYIFHLVWLPQKVGGVFVGRRRFGVAARRLESLLPAAPTSDPLSEVRPAPFLGGPASPPIIRPQRIPLESVTVRGLTITNRNVHDISFELTRGSLTVISGPVGSGKTSLMRALIGLLEADSGEIRWNGAVVADPGAFFVPPQCAYVSQVPNLFSDSLLENLLLGATADPTEAIRLAALDDDVASMPEGLATKLGAGGVRLSGGQVQRAAAARALLHSAELIVLDDLTSALDVETELRLWDRLAAANVTVLAVSNRTVARNRADRIIEM
jgi:ATP-binding cassette, subfamily B, bacterial